MKKTKELNTKNKTTRNNKGITLIALIITIIVMLILVSVTISMAVNGGLFDYAGRAARETKNAINAENELAKGRIQIGGVWYDSIGDYLKNKPSSNQGETDEEDEINAVGVVDNENTITLASNLPNDTYTLKYENNSGVLQNYKEICTLTATADSGTRVYDDFIAENCAPVEATIIGVYNSSNQRVGDIALGHLATNLGNKLYSFGALADIHIGESGSDTKVPNALTYLTEIENVAFTCIPGDLTQNASDSEFQKLKTIINQYSKPIYVSTGNHDTPTYRGTDDITNEFIQSYTGNPHYYSFTHGNDVFIMVGIREGQEGQLFFDGELEWLYETLEANKNKRCFVFQHVFPFDEGCGNAGDFYDFDIWGVSDESSFESLMERYSNAIFFHGHSHTVFEGQAIDNMANYSYASNSHSVHIPSVTEPRDLTGETNAALSQGYVIDVYNNSIVLRGIDFINGKFLPIAYYNLDTTAKAISSSEVILPLNTEWQHGVKLDKTTGNESTDSSYSASSMIPVNGCKFTTGWLWLDSSLPAVCCYDEDTNYLGWVSAAEDGTYTLLDGTQYVRFRAWFGGGTLSNEEIINGYLWITKTFTAE